MKISVVVPTYKPKYYLWECLNSLKEQTFPVDDFEILLVLNGCCEPYKSEIEEYLLKNVMSNVYLIQVDQPGVSNARNIALDYAKGSYVAFIDDDDYVSPFYLEELYAKASLDTISLCYPYAFNDGTPEMQLPYYITDAYMKLIPMDIIKERRFDINFRNGEDTLFMFLISDRFRYFAITSPSAVYYRRYRLGSALFNKRSLKERVINCILHQFYYVRIFVSNPFKYNFTFFVSRFLGEFVSIRN